MQYLTLSNNIRVSGDYDEIALKRSLTFKNPQYASVKKFSRYSFTNVPEHLFYYEKDGIYLNVPIGTSFAPDSFEIAEDKRVTDSVEYPSFNLILREDQKIAVENYLEKNTIAFPISGLISLSTGLGKSIAALYIAEHLKAKTLILVHKNDLVVGWQKDIELSFGGKLKAGLIKAQKRDIGEQITIATVQTIARMKEEDLEELYQTFSLVVSDETHHSPASTFSVINNFNSRYKLGLSATPERSDGLTHVLNLYFGEFAYKHVNKANEKDILPVLVKTRKCNVICTPLVKRVGNKTSFIRFSDNPYDIKNGEFPLDSIPYEQRPRIPYADIDDFIMLHPSFGDLVLEDILNEFDEGRSIVVFFTRKEHCEIYRDNLVELRGEDSVMLYYGDSKEKDSVMLERAENTKPFITLTTYAKGTEGTNVKQWEVAFLVSSINNEKNVEQAVGRIRRTKEGKISPCIVYDYALPNVYSMRNHFSTRSVRYKKLGCQIEGYKTFNRP